MELYARGRRILVDNGYGSEVPESKGDTRYRMWRVGSSAHNIATVDDQDIIPVRGEYRYGYDLRPLIDDWRSESSYAYFSGVHEGYRHLPDEISATRRKLFYLRGRYWIMIDRFTPAGAPKERDYRLHFHIKPACRLGADGASLQTEGDGGNLLIAPVKGAGGKATLEPNPFPIRGYENPSHLCYLHRTDQRWLFVTLMVPFEGERAPRVEASLLPVECDGRELSPWESTGLEIRIDGERHVYVDHHMHWSLPWRCGGFEGEQRLFHSATA
jgi:hypothetical protein